MTDQGQGPPLVLIPGIQGRWEWMAPTVRALARHHRVLSFSLAEAKGARLFDRWVDLVDRILDKAGERTAAVVGVSFGGLVGAYYAAQRRQRVTRLVLVSAPSPRWRLDAQSARYVKRPRISLPLFAGRAVRRLAPEFLAALPTIGSRAGFMARYAGSVLRFPASPKHMAACVHAWDETDLIGACHRVGAPTLVITGEESLDRVVPVASSLEYLSLIAGARHATLDRTGHLGLVLKPREFAVLVTDFVTSKTPADEVRGVNGRDRDLEPHVAGTGRSA